MADTCRLPALVVGTEADQFFAQTSEKSRSDCHRGIFCFGRTRDQVFDHPSHATSLLTRWSGVTYADRDDRSFLIRHQSTHQRASHNRSHVSGRSHDLGAIVCALCSGRLSSRTMVNHHRFAWIGHPAGIRRHHRERLRQQKTDGL